VRKPDQPFAASTFTQQGLSKCHRA